MAFNILAAFICFLVLSSARSPTTDQPAVHIPLFRRGGRFARHQPANLTRLSDVLKNIEAKYARSYREIEGNGLVRRWRENEAFDENDPELIDVVGREDRWYTTLEVGDPKQRLEVDVDMLSPDFYAVLTTSAKGSRYDTFASRSHGPSDDRVHPTCKQPSDEFHLPGISEPVRLDFPICTPSKSSRQSLAHSGTFLGLAPGLSLQRLASTSLLSQLIARSTVKNKIWSVTLLDAESGILSLGGTIAREVEEAKLRGAVELRHFGDALVTSEWVLEQVNNQMTLSMPLELPWDHHFKWTKVQGASGWWTALMAGVWVNGAKVLKNQPILFDINVPFILAPPLAARRFYESIGGTKRLPPPYESFFAFPCLNRVNIAFEIGGWTFPNMNGEGTTSDALHGPAGGRFSLGKLADGTGYCVGSVVETEMGTSKDWTGSGMKDMWVLGEPFLRGLGVVFDIDNGRVGVRTY